MSTSIWFVLAFVYIDSSGMHDVLGIADSHGHAYNTKQECAASAATLANAMSLPQKSWKFDCHEMNIVVDSNENTVFVKFPNY